MNRNATKTYLFLCFTVIAILFSALYPKHVNNQNREKEIVYIVKEEQGKIAVFSSENTEPVTVTDVSTSFLPEKDRIRLQEGITVMSKEEVYRLIEDFSG